MVTIFVLVLVTKIALKQ